MERSGIKDTTKLLSADTAVKDATTNAAVFAVRDRCYSSGNDAAMRGVCLSVFVTLSTTRTPMQIIVKRGRDISPYPPAITCSARSIGRWQASSATLMNIMQNLSTVTRVCAKLRAAIRAA